MSAVRVSCESLRILKIRTVDTIVLNMLKTIAAFGDVLRWRKRAYDEGRDPTTISTMSPEYVWLLNSYTIVAQNRDRGLSELQNLQFFAM